MAAITAANVGHARSYGADRHTAALSELFKEQFGAEAEAFLVFNGTGANLACIDAVTRGHEATICSELAHMNVQEGGAPERIAGSKLLTIATEHGKFTPADIKRWEAQRGNHHFQQPRLVSISEATELGTVYTAEEIGAIAGAAHQLGMLLHVDGARLSNAAASLEVPLRALTTDAGVDLLSFGGTKNGLMLGDAVVFLQPGLGDGFEFVRKQLGQLASKMRFVAVQFEALLKDGLWLHCADHANQMASRLAKGIGSIDGVEIVHPVEANAVFARLDRRAIDRLLEAWPYDYPFKVWDHATDVVRWMCAWDTEQKDVDDFVTAVAEAVGEAGPSRRFQ